MSDNNKTPKASKSKKQQSKNGIIGILQMFVVISIVYMAAVIWMGTDGYAAKAMTIPAVAYVGLLVFTKFTKQ